MAVPHSEHIPQWKKDEIEYIKNNISSYRVVGLVGLRGIPSVQLQQIRKNMRDVAVLKMCRNTLIDRALAEAPGEVKSLSNYLSDQTALVFSNENPFKLYKMLEKGKTKAPIKAGGIAPKDIVVNKGPTSFPPGPIVGELTSSGIPAAVEGGKVVIRETKTVAKAGDVVNAKLATMLGRLDIRPVELGLNLRVVYENGLIYKPENLIIDEIKYKSDFISAFQRAFNLSVNAAYPTKTTISALIAQAATRSRNLAVNADLIIPEIIDLVLSKAHTQMLSVAGVISEKNPDVLGAKLKEMLKSRPKTAGAPVKEAPVEKKEEKKAEEKKEEVKQEEVAAGLGALFG